MLSAVWIRSLADSICTVYVLFLFALLLCYLYAFCFVNLAGHIELLWKEYRCSAFLDQIQNRFSRWCGPGVWFHGCKPSDIVDAHENWCFVSYDRDFECRRSFVTEKQPFTR